MEVAQNRTEQNENTDDVTVNYSYKMLNPIQQTYVDWKALNGLVTDDDGMRKITLEDLAHKLQIGRRTFYDQTSHIPNLYDIINQRRIEISGKSRLQRVHETWYLKAVKGDWQHMDAWLLNFDPNYKTPKLKVEHEAGGSWASLLTKINQGDERKVIDGEVTDATGTDNNRTV